MTTPDAAACAAVQPGNYNASRYIPICQRELGHDGNHVAQNYPQHWVHGFGYISLPGPTWRQSA